MHSFLIVSLVLISCGKFSVLHVIVDTNNFIDDWNPIQNQTQNFTPLLNNDGKTHILPIADNTELNVDEIEINSKQRGSKGLEDPVRSIISCPICKIGVTLLQTEVSKRNSTFEDIKEKFVSLCVGLDIQTETVCSGIFDVYGPEVLPVLSLMQIDTTEACSLILGETCGNTISPIHDWNVQFPKQRNSNNQEELQNVKVPHPLAKTFKVLQIADTHYDALYIVGAVANCQEPLCCQRNSTPVKGEPLVPAGKWGSYKKCDSPRILLEHMLKHIAEEHPDIDYILWTGDLPAHDIWNQTKSSVLETFTESIQMIFEHFPTVPVFPVLGNHESVPPGSFAPGWMKDISHSIDWLYQKAADQWQLWLPTSITNTTILHGGFYSVLVRPKFRLIGLNTNYCSSYSWWLTLNSTDPAKELEWLINELQQAEDASETVHFLGHIAPGSVDCLKIWSQNFHRIVERYSNTIRAQFYAHSHADEFEIFYANGTNRPINVAYLGPSVTTYENYNPAYRIYYIDSETTKEVIDHETWTMNLTDANINPVRGPKWYRLYAAKSSYLMQSLRPQDWHEFFEKLVINPKLFDYFYRNYFRESDVRPECDSKCKLQILCDLKSAKSHQRRTLCKDLKRTFVN